eukprot:362948-Chlamydomonas_euryale.AAC.15
MSPGWCVYQSASLTHVRFCTNVMKRSYASKHGCTANVGGQSTKRLCSRAAQECRARASWRPM